MGTKSRNKRMRRHVLNRGAAPGVTGPTEMPPEAFQNILVRPINSLVNLRGKDPKKPLNDGQLLVTLDKYAIIPLERYQDLLKVAKQKTTAVEVALAYAKAEAKRRKAEDAVSIDEATT